MSGLPEPALPTKDGLTWDECAARWSLSVNAVRTRAKQLGITPIYIERIAHWPGEFIEFGDAFHEWRSTYPHEKVEVFLGRTGAPTPDQKKQEVVEALVKKGDAERAAELMVAGMKTMASELKLLQKEEEAPPLLRAKMLAEVADNGLVVTNDELRAIGVNTTNRGGNGFDAFGYRFTAHRHHQSTNSERFWTCDRLFRPKPGQVPTLQSTGRTVGFDTGEPIAAAATGFNFGQPTLPVI